jgi:hypothetical protein
MQTEMQTGMQAGMQAVSGRANLEELLAFFIAQVPGSLLDAAAVLGGSPNMPLVKSKADFPGTHSCLLAPLLGPSVVSMGQPCCVLFTRHQAPVSLCVSHPSTESLAHSATPPLSEELLFDHVSRL